MARQDMLTSVDVPATQYIFDIMSLLFLCILLLILLRTKILSMCYKRPILKKFGIVPVDRGRQWVREKGNHC